MPLAVSDVRSNAADQIAHAVEVLGRSRQRLAIFKAIYRGQKQVKTVNEIATATGIKRVRVLQEGRRLADNQIVTQVRAAGMTAYRKDRFYSAQKDRIVRLVQNPVARAALPTKTRPKPTWPKSTAISMPTQRIQVRHITIDDIDSFHRVTEVRAEPGEYTAMAETRFKKGIARILGEGGQFSDWGGERNDLYTDKVRISGRRRLAAFAFKGRGTTGILTPKKMGTNGDQIQRLFKTPADVFLVQYWAQVAESIVEQMVEFAKAKSAVQGSRVFFGVIDGDDSNRLLWAYPKAFRR